MAGHSFSRLPCSRPTGRHLFVLARSALVQKYGFNRFSPQDIYGGVGSPQRVQPEANFPYADVTGTAAVRRPSASCANQKLGRKWPELGNL